MDIDPIGCTRCNQYAKGTHFVERIFNDKKLYAVKRESKIWGKLDPGAAWFDATHKRPFLRPKMVNTIMRI